MARYLANLTNGQIDEKGLFRLFGVLLNQSGVIQTGAFQVAAQGTPDMTVKVPGAVIGHDIVFIHTDGATYHGWNTADEPVNILSNASGVTKTDAIVAYANLTDGIATSNNPGGLDLVAVRRSGSNTGAPTSGEISTAVASNPYVVLAHVTVANGASSINSGNISDQRTLSRIPGTRLNNVTTATLGSTSWTNGIITGLTSTVQSGSSTNGTYHTTMTVDISGLSIPSTALILDATFWLIPADNSGAKKASPAVVTSVAYNSVTLHSQWGFTTANALNNTNSAVLGRVRYIA